MIYVTSDWHGYPLEKIKELFASVSFSEEDYCYILGDVVDRGEESAELLQWIMQMPNIELLLGNHEAMLLSCRFLFDEVTEESIDSLEGENVELASAWLSNGGDATVKSLLKLEPAEREAIYEYVKGSSLYECLTVGERDFILTHSGLGNFDKCKKMRDYTENDLLWNRPTLQDRYYDDIITVFGHTPTGYLLRENDGKAIATETWIDVDTGAASGRPPMLLRLDDLQEFYLKR